MGSDNTDGRPREENHPDRPRDGDDDAVRTVALEEVDQRIVDLLSWILDTETRAKIYVFLLANPASTAEEVATGTGLYPSTVREALAELHDEERVTREKRANDGAGTNPYAYTAIQPSDLVGGVVDQVQRELNTIFTLDSILERPSDGGSDLEPVTITVDDTDPTESTDDTSGHGRNDVSGPSTDGNRDSDADGNRDSDADGNRDSDSSMSDE